MDKFWSLQKYKTPNNLFWDTIYVLHMSNNFIILLLYNIMEQKQLKTIKKILKKINSKTCFFNKIHRVLVF